MGHQIEVEKLQNQIEKSSNEAKIATEDKNFFMIEMIQEEEENEKLQKENRELKKQLLWDLRLGKPNRKGQKPNPKKKKKRKIDNKLPEVSNPKKKKSTN